MKKLLLVFLIAASLHADDKPITGQWYKGLAKSNRIGYVYGYLEGYAIGRNFAAREAARMLYDAMSENTRKIVLAETEAAKDKVKENLGALCLWVPGENATSGQLTAILDKYIADHPERWDKPIRELAEEAFIEACEKRAEKP